MDTNGRLIDARLIVKYSYRAGARLSDCNLIDVLGGANYGSNEINVYLAGGSQNERLERLCERYECRLQEYERRGREWREHERRERERRRRGHRYKELRDGVLCFLAILLIIFLWAKLSG